MLFETVYRNECTSTHHKLAMDALRHFRDKQGENWRRLFVRHYEDYLEGSKAPDKQFRDFKNHVLHVSDNYWGGVVKAAAKWYDRAVESFVKQDWVEGVYCVGVLSHYYTDVLMPFHTGQTEEEGKVHRAFEWSVCKSYDEIMSLVSEYPELETPGGDHWLRDMIHAGAEQARGADAGERCHRRREQHERHEHRCDEHEVGGPGRVIGEQLPPRDVGARHQCDDQQHQRRQDASDQVGPSRPVALGILEECIPRRGDHGGQARSMFLARAHESMPCIVERRRSVRFPEGVGHPLHPRHGGAAP